MRDIEIETEQLWGGPEALAVGAGSLVELILAVADGSDDAFEIADRVDAAILSGAATVTHLA